MRQLVCPYEVSRQAPFRHLIAFSLDARTVHAHDQASCLRVPASSVSAFFRRRRSPRTLRGGERRRRKNALPRRTLPRCGCCLRNPVVGWRLVRPERKTPGQPSIRVTTATAATTHYLVRSKRPERQNRESTHRTNGALAGYPAA